MPVLAAPSERRRRRRQCNAVLVLGSTLQGLLLVDITTAVEPSSAWSTFLCPNNYYNAGDPSPRFSRSSASTNATDRNMLDPGYGYDVAGGEQDEMEVMDDMFVSLLSDTSIKLSDLVRHFCHAWPFQRIRDQMVATALDSFDSMMIMSEQQDETHQPPLPLEWPNLRLWVRDASRRIRDQVVAPALLIAETTKIALRGQDKNETTLEEDGSETATKRINDNAEPSSSSGRQRRRSMELVQTVCFVLCRVRYYCNHIESNDIPRRSASLRQNKQICGLVK